MNTLNLGIFAHVDAGKTTLTERILGATGAIRRLGSVDEGTAQTDRMTVERERGISVRDAAATVTSGEARLNIIDTPGHTDFAGECERALKALDCAVLVVSALEGVQPHTEALWYAMRRLKLPAVVFINKLDRDGADPEAVFRDLRRMDEVCRGEGDAPAVFAALTSPEETEAYDAGIMTASLADCDDDAADAFLEEKTLPVQILLQTAARLALDGAAVPVLYGCAKDGRGVNALLTLLSETAAARKQDDPDGALSAYVYKLEHDAQFGHTAQVRVFSGSLRAREALTPLSPDGRSRREGKVTLLRSYAGAKASDAPRLDAGEIGAVYGLPEVRPGDWLGAMPENAVDAALANPYLTVRLTPESDEKLTPLVEAVQELSEEEPRLGCVWEKTTRELSVNVAGEVQTEILAAILRERYGLNPAISPPSVIYRETPSRAGRGFEAYTMPKPCWAIVDFAFEPLPRGSGVVYDGGRVPNNRLFYKYQTHIRTAFFDCLQQGIKGWEVTDFKCTLTDGEHHTVHTHPLDFFVAVPMAFLDGLRSCGTTLLEPVLLSRITVPEDLAGRVMADVLHMRGEFDTPVIRAGTATIEAHLPVKDSLDYPVKLASLSSGRARYGSRFWAWRDIPDELGTVRPYRGICPLDRAKWILYARGAITLPD